MNIKNIFKKEFVVGLDIGTNSVKIAYFRENEGSPHLIKADLKEIEKSDAVSVEEKALSAIKYLFRGIDLRRSKVNVSINCPKTSIKKCTVPYMPKAELSRGIKLELKNHFPFSSDDSEFDYEILEDVVKKGVRKYEVALAVSPKMTVDKYLKVLTKAGIKPSSFVPCAYALEKFAVHSYLFSREGHGHNTSCFIDIGELYSELIILKGKELMFSRKIPIMGKDFTKSLTVALASDRGKTELSMADAEKIKREIGIPSLSDSKIIDGKIATTQILSMIRSPLEHLVNEMDRCFHYYREETAGDKIDKVVLFGGGASLSGLIGFLSEELGLEVSLGDSFEGISIDKSVISEREKISHRLELAVGAALSGVKNINLLPAEIKQETKMIVRRGTVEGVVTAVLLISALLYIGMRIQLGNFEKQISVAQKELDSLEPQHKKAEAHHLANMVLVEEPHWEDGFKELSNIVPDSVHLTSMSMEDKVIVMDGIVISGDGEGVLSDFVLTLEEEMFTDVKLVSIVDLETEDGKAGNRFKLKCWLD
ncbi:MAG: pilus assembly protein PilM [Candidatus Omnitrophica bacterium]|nr:pilus assembly protein PilM [Candidatus Omnitrophota bacterium]